MTISRASRRTVLSLAAAAAMLAAASPASALVEAGPIVEPSGGHSYFLLAPGNWSTAESEALARGGHLVAIGDEAENTWVWSTFSAIANGPFWIGLTDVAQEGVFVWTNGEPVTYTSWWTAGGEPNNAGGVEHFAELNNGLWNDNAGTSAFRAVIEVERAFGFVEAEATPPDGAAYAPVVTPDGAHVYALYDVASGTDLLLAFERAGDGALTALGTPTAIAANPNVLATSPDDTTLFVASNNGEVQAWRRAPATGLLSYGTQVNDDASGGGYLQYTYGVAVSPDGANVYAAGGENAVTTLDWDGENGTLTLLETDVTGTGGLVLSAPGPIAVTPDGAFVLVVSQLDSALVVFERNPATGALDFVERFVDETNGVDGLSGPYAITVAPTAGGSAAYVSSFENEIAVFSQTPSGVSFVEAVPVASLQPALEVSPDGTLLYGSDRYASRVNAYQRDPATGEIGPLVAAITDADPGVDGLAQAGLVAASPDGLHVYVASATDDAIAVLVAPVPEPGGAWLAAAALLSLGSLARRREGRRGHS